MHNFLLANVWSTQIQNYPIESWKAVMNGRCFGCINLRSYLTHSDDIIIDRTKQTARKSTGSKDPRKQLARKATPAGHACLWVWSLPGGTLYLLRTMITDDLKRSAVFTTIRESTLGCYYCNPPRGVITAMHLGVLLLQSISGCYYCNPSWDVITGIHLGVLWLQSFSGCHYFLGCQLLKWNKFQWTTTKQLSIG